MHNEQKRRADLGLDNMSKWERKVERVLTEYPKTILAILVVVAIASILIISTAVIIYEKPTQVLPDPCELDLVYCHTDKIEYRASAYVTGYNTVVEQTDETPCYARDIFICGRTDVVACPRDIPFGTKVTIDKKTYECLDRTALKHDGKFDISCDKDMKCPYEVTGWKIVAIHKMSTE